MSLHIINDHVSESEFDYHRAAVFPALTGLRDQGRCYNIARAVHYVARNQLRPEEKQLFPGFADSRVESNENVASANEV